MALTAEHQKHPIEDPGLVVSRRFCIRVHVRPRRFEQLQAPHPVPQLAHLLVASVSLLTPFKLAIDHRPIVRQILQHTGCPREHSPVVRKICHRLFDHGLRFIVRPQRPQGLHAVGQCGSAVSIRHRLGRCQQRLRQIRRLSVVSCLGEFPRLLQLRFSLPWILS